MLESDEEIRMGVLSLAAHILAAQESERKRLAYELQENLAQAIVGTKIKAEQALAALHAGNGDTACGFLCETVPLLQGVLDEARRISADLRPPLLDDLGLAAAISCFCREFRETHPDIEVDVQVPQQDVPEPVKTVIYRVLQEAADNVARHAQAKNLLVVLRRRPLGTDLLVADDGRGFDAEASLSSRRGLGLAIVKERVEALSGSLTIESTPNRGTWVRALWLAL
jgi:signal transduction histidine kinase